MRTNGMETPAIFLTLQRSDIALIDLKVLLIQPPVQDFYDTDVRLQPIGLCYLKAAVRTHLPDVDIIIKDYHAGCGRRTVEIPKELRYLADYYPVVDNRHFRPFISIFTSASPSMRSKSKSRRSLPDVVGISSLFTPYYREALEVAARVKKGLNYQSSSAAPMLQRRRNPCSPHLMSTTLSVAKARKHSLNSFNI